MKSQLIICSLILWVFSITSYAADGKIALEKAVNRHLGHGEIHGFTTYTTGVGNGGASAILISDADMGGLRKYMDNRIRDIRVFNDAQGALQGKRMPRPDLELRFYVEAPNGLPIGSEKLPFPLRLNSALLANLSTMAPNAVETRTFPLPIVEDILNTKKIGHQNHLYAFLNEGVSGKHVLGVSLGTTPKKIANTVKSRSRLIGILSRGAAALTGTASIIAGIASVGANSANADQLLPNIISSPVLHRQKKVGALFEEAKNGAEPELDLNPANANIGY